MTIHSFAFTPRRCERCGRRFWLELCEPGTKFVGIEQRDLRVWYCMDCWKKRHPERAYDMLNDMVVLDHSAKCKDK